MGTVLVATRVSIGMSSAAYSCLLMSVSVCMRMCLCIRACEPQLEKCSGETL